MGSTPFLLLDLLEEDVAMAICPSTCESLAVHDQAIAAAIVLTKY
jgi:hypothetical protein